MQITIPLTAILLVLVASGLGALGRWLSQRLGASDAISFWIGLLIFGLILLFGKIT